MDSQVLNEQEEWLALNGIRQTSLLHSVCLFACHCVFPFFFLLPHVKFSFMDFVM